VWLAIAVAALGVSLAAASVLIFEEGGKSAEGGRERPPADGELIRAEGGQTLWVMKAGAKFPLAPDEHAAFGHTRGDVREVPREELLEIPNIPRRGTLVRTHSSTVIWEIREGTRHLVDPPAGADVTVIPRLGLPQIPLPAGGRKTSVTVDAPVFVGEHQHFLIHAQVRASGGDRPRGRCLFYQISRAGLKERANHATRAATCTAELNVSGINRVRYSIHFIGDRGWRPSSDATRWIRVLPGQ
jgi:hypothetical protein